MQRKNQCQKECLILDQQISTTVIVSHFVENSESKICPDEDSMLHRGVDSFIVENSAYVYNITIAEDKFSSLDELFMQDINLVIHSPISDSLYFENIIDHKVERCSSQDEDENAGNDMSSDEGEVADLTYCKEASCEDNDESGCLSQEEDSENIFVFI